VDALRVATEEAMASEGWSELVAGCLPLTGVDGRSSVSLEAPSAVASSGMVVEAN